MRKTSELKRTIASSLLITIILLTTLISGLIIYKNLTERCWYILYSEADRFEDVVIEQMKCNELSMRAIGYMLLDDSDNNVDITDSVIAASNKIDNVDIRLYYPDGRIYTEQGLVDSKTYQLDITNLFSNEFSLSGLHKDWLKNGRDVVEISTPILRDGKIEFMVAAVVDVYHLNEAGIYMGDGSMLMIDLEGHNALRWVDGEITIVTAEELDERFGQENFVENLSKQLQNEGLVRLEQDSEDGRKEYLSILGSDVIKGWACGIYGYDTDVFAFINKMRTILGIVVLSEVLVCVAYVIYYQKIIRKQIANLDTKLLEISKVLGRNYERLYYVDMNDNSYARIMSDGNDWVRMEESEGDFFEEAVGIMERFAYKDDIEQVRIFTDKEKIINLMQHEKSVSRDVRVVLGDKIKYYRVYFAIAKNDKNHFIAAAEDIDTEVNSRRENERNIQEKNAAVQALDKKDEEVRTLERDALLYEKAVLGNACCYYKVNLTCNEIIPPVIEMVDMQPVDFTDKATKGAVEYDRIIAMNAEEYVAKKDKKAYKAFFEISNLLRMFKEGETTPEFVCNIWSSSQGWHYRKYVCFMSEDEDSGEVFAMVVAYNVTDEMLQEEEKWANIERIMSLGDNFETIYDIDVTSGEYNEYTRYEDMNGDVQLISKSHDRFFDENGEAMMDNIHPDDSVKIRKWLSRSVMLIRLENHTYFTADFRRNSGGQVLWYKMRVARSGDWKKKKRILIGVFNNDENYRKEKDYQSRLKNALYQAKSSDRSKTVFLSNMSHDIRTPMNAILGYNRLAQKNLDDTDKAMSYLKKIDDASGHLLNLINDVLDMSRIESGKVSLIKESYRLSEIVGTLTDMVKVDSAQKGMDFTVECDSIVHDYVICDKLRLNQILINILNNAVKYTKVGGSILFRVTEGEADEEGRIQYIFFVKDTGVGMSKEFLQKIYEPFTRVNTTTVSGVQGTGLGMSITKSLVEIMEGSIDIKSKENVGTEVTVVLNFDIAEEPTEDGGNNAEKDTEQISKMNILVVEDNEMNREITCELLKELGASTATATDGTEAVDIMANAKEGDFDLILMDVQMPIMNGLDATRKIRSMDEDWKKQLPIIAMTANAFEEDKNMVIEAGMNEHIAKPVSVQRLVQVLARFSNGE